MHKSLYIFTRDLRVQDNTALCRCFKESSEVLCCFIFTPEQIDNNEFKSLSAIKFMIESLEDLSSELASLNLQLYFYHGEHDKVIDRLHSKHNFSAVYHTIDYTPYARMRDQKIREWCISKSVLYSGSEDNLIPIIGETLSQYKKFTPFYNAAKVIKIVPELVHGAIPRNIDTQGEKPLATPEVPSPRGGRAALPRDKIATIMRNYDKLHNDLSAGTTMLSPYLKFGCIGVREVYRMTRNEAFIRQLYWREFYYRIVWYWGHVLSGPNRNFNENYRKIRWRNTLPEEWKTGRTGFPIVDAGMRDRDHRVAGHEIVERQFRRR